MEWLVHLYDDEDAQFLLPSLTCALMLVVLNDTKYQVTDGNAGVGFSVKGDQMTEWFDDYASKILPRLEVLKSGRTIDYELNKVIGLWQQHADAAAIAR